MYVGKDNSYIDLYFKDPVSSIHTNWSDFIRFDKRGFTNMDKYNGGRYMGFKSNKEWE